MIDARYESQLENLNVQPFLGAASIAKGSLAYVKHVQVRSNFHQKLQQRCVHYKDIDTHGYDRETAEGTRFADLTFDLLQVLQRLARQSLRSFRSVSPYHTKLNFGYQANPCNTAGRWEPVLLPNY
jgi:hypothetical protein